MRRAALLLALLTGCAENYSRESDRTPAQAGALILEFWEGRAPGAPAIGVVRIQSVVQPGDLEERAGPQDVLDLAAWSGGQPLPLDRLEALSKSGTRHVGAGHSLRESLEGAIINVRNVRLGLLSLRTGGASAPMAGWADRAGLAPLQFEEARLAVERLRRQADLVVIRLHSDAGVEMTQTRREVLRALLRSGADAVVGTPGAGLDWELHNLRPLLLSWPGGAPAPLRLEVGGARIRSLSFEFEEESSTGLLQAAGWKADPATRTASFILPRL